MNAFRASITIFLILHTAIISAEETEKNEEGTTGTITTMSTTADPENTEAIMDTTVFVSDDNTMLDDNVIVYLRNSCQIVYMRGEEADFTKLEFEKTVQYNCEGKRIVAFTGGEGNADDGSESRKTYLALMNKETRPIRFTPLRFQVDLATKDNRPYYATEGPTSSFFLPYHKKADETILVFSTIDGGVGVMFFREETYTVCIYPVKMLRNNYLVFERTFSVKLVNETLLGVEPNTSTVYVRNQRNGMPVIYYCSNSNVVEKELADVKIENREAFINDSVFLWDAVRPMQTKQIRLAQYKISNPICEKLKESENEGGGYVTLKQNRISPQIIFDNAQPRFMNLRMIKFETRERHVRTGWFIVVLPVITTSLALMIVFRYLGGNFRGLRPIS